MEKWWHFPLRDIDLGSAYLGLEVWRPAEIVFGLVLYRVPCQCRALAWPFSVINRKVCSAKLE